MRATARVGLLLRMPLSFACIAGGKQEQQAYQASSQLQGANEGNAAIQLTWVCVTKPHGSGGFGMET